MLEKWPVVNSLLDETSANGEGRNGNEEKTNKL